MEALGQPVQHHGARRKRHTPLRMLRQVASEAGDERHEQTSAEESSDPCGQGERPQPTAKEARTERALAQNLRWRRKRLGEHANPHETATGWSAANQHAPTDQHSCVTKPAAPAIPPIASTGTRAHGNHDVTIPSG